MQYFAVQRKYNVSNSSKVDSRLEDYLVWHYTRRDYQNKQFNDLEAWSKSWFKKRKHDEWGRRIDRRRLGTNTKIEIKRKGKTIR